MDLDIVNIILYLVVLFNQLYFIDDFDLLFIINVFLFNIKIISNKDILYFTFNNIKLITLNQMILKE